MTIGAQSAVLGLGKPTKLQRLDYTRDLRVTLYKITLGNGNQRRCLSLRRIWGYACYYDEL